MDHSAIEWAFTLTSSFLFYHDYDQLEEASRNTYRMEMADFGGIAPTYHIALFDKPTTSPTIVWDFHSLLIAIQLMFSFMLTDEEKPLRLCERCQKAFVASRSNNVFCSPLEHFIGIKFLESILDRFCRAASQTVLQWQHMLPSNRS